MLCCVLLLVVVLSTEVITDCRRGVSSLLCANVEGTDTGAILLKTDAVLSCEAAVLLPPSLSDMVAVITVGPCRLLTCCCWCCCW